MQALSRGKQTAYRIAYAKLSDIIYVDMESITLEDLRAVVTR